MPKPSKKKEASETEEAGDSSVSNYPRHSLDKALRIPKAILEQNAGKDCTDREAIAFAGVGWNGPSRVELSSAIKYGLLRRPSPGKVSLTETARKIVRPQKPSDETEALRAAALNAPVIKDVYQHYRGENLPDAEFLRNALVDKFKIPAEKIAEFLTIFNETLTKSGLIEKHGDKSRLIDISHSADRSVDNKATITKLSKDAAVTEGDSCFVIMPFAAPHGTYYGQIFAKAIEKAGLRSVRADAELFGTGKIIDQIWQGITEAKVLLAELTTRNPNVFYELGLAHALGKPVVLVSGNEQDVPFDLRHIRVIYYDTSDPFWGQKLLDKVAENLLSAIKNPEEALFKNALAS